MNSMENAMLTRARLQLLGTNSSKEDEQHILMPWKINCPNGGQLGLFVYRLQFVPISCLLVCKNEIVQQVSNAEELFVLMVDSGICQDTGKSLDVLNNAFREFGFVIHAAEDVSDPDQHYFDDFLKTIWHSPKVSSAGLRLYVYIRIPRGEIWFIEISNGYLNRNKVVDM